MKEIKIGHTNKIKYVDGNKFIIKKTYTGFNHKLDYGQLKEFDFVPKLISDSKEEIVWEFIDGEMINKWTNEDLTLVAKHLRELHKSSIKLPKNNFRQRINEYLKQIHEKRIHVDAIENSYREMLKILANMNTINACHNDVWYENILKNKDGKIFLVDWEYAIMGDKHFDLAFFITSNRLNEQQENLFLSVYNSFDDYEAYNPALIPKYKRFVYYITLCWAYAQDKMPFDVSSLEKELLKK